MKADEREITRQRLHGDVQRHVHMGRDTLQLLLPINIGIKEGWAVSLSPNHQKQSNQRVSTSLREDVHVCASMYGFIHVRMCAGQYLRPTILHMCEWLHLHVPNPTCN